MYRNTGCVKVHMDTGSLGNVYSRASIWGIQISRCGGVRFRLEPTEFI